MATLIPSRLSFAGVVRPGNTIDVRWIVGHPMETGFRVDDAGQRIPRHIVTRVRVLLDERPIMEIEPGTGLSANPQLTFSLVVPAQGGRVRVEWMDEAGQRGSVQQTLPLQG